LEVRGSGFEVVDSSTQATVTTMDTTSHNFTWQIDTLGDGGGSVLYDVAIINDTLAYAVGEIYKRDSVGNWDPLPYNLVKWNGERWELKRVPFYYQGSTWYLPLRCITAFAPDDIWFEAGIHWDGTRYITVPYTIDYPARINKSWGTSSRDFYVVGDAGLIAHYDGVRWRRIESGTRLDVYDVHGGSSLEGEAPEIIAVAARQFSTLDNRVLKVSSSGATVVSNAGIVSSIHGLWFVPRRKYYIVGGGMYSKKNISPVGSWQSFHSGVTQYYQYAMTGRGLNDVFSVGSFGEVLHFNGLTWRSFREVTVIQAGAFYNVSLSNDFVVAVGYESPKAVVARGYRR